MGAVIILQGSQEPNPKSENKMFVHVVLIGPPKALCLRCELQNAALAIKGGGRWTQAQLGPIPINAKSENSNEMGTGEAIYI